MNTICRVCTSKNDNAKLHRLELILNTLEQGGIRKAPLNGSREHLLWGSRMHCRYGIACPQIEQTESRCRSLENRIEGYFEPLFISKNEALFWKILRLMQGYFPDVYRYLEREWRKRV